MPTSWPFRASLSKYALLVAGAAIHIRTAGAYVACYALWLVTMVLAALDVLALRNAVEQAYVALRFERWGMAAASHGATILLGVAWIALVAWTETAYREGVRDGRVWKRFAVVTILQALPLSLLLWR